MKENVKAKSIVKRKGQCENNSEIESKNKILCK